MTHVKAYNLVVAGVGGMGVLTTARILGSAAVTQNYKVRVGEVHGMAQRGGIMEVQVRIGEDIFAPTIMEGQADLLLGFEWAEALRQAHKLSRDGTAIINEYRITPTLVTLGQGSYPSLDATIRALKHLTKNVFVIKAIPLARQAGSVVTLGSVLLGAAIAVKGFPLTMKTVKETFKDLLKTRLLNENLKALELGYHHAKTQQTFQ